MLLPQEAVRVYNWKGSGYLVLDPDSFSASYLIEGGLSGGSMSVKEAFSHYWKYVEEGLAGLVLMELFKYVLMAMSGNFYYLLLFELGFAAACIGYAGFLNLFQQFLETKDTSYLQEMEIRIAAMLTVGVIRLGPGKQAFDNLDAMAYERIYLSATGAGEQVCSAFLRSYGSANLPQAESAILSLRNQGFSDAQLLTVAEDFSVSLIPSVEGAFEQIGPMNAAEIDAALTLLKMAETTAAIEAMGTELSLIRQSGILLELESRKKVL